MSIIEYLTRPNPGLNMVEEHAFPPSLAHYHVMVMIEPDWHAWCAQPRGEPGLAWWEYRHQRIWDEIFELKTRLLEIPEYLYTELTEHGAEIPSASQYRLVWVGTNPPDFGEEPFTQYRHMHAWSDEIAAQVGEFVERSILWISFGSQNRDFHDLLLYLRGAAALHPDWQVAVLGGMLEDEVVQVANAIQELGLSTHLLVNMCERGEDFRKYTTPPNEEIYKDTDFV